MLAAVPLERGGGRVEFAGFVGGDLKPARLEIFQVNLGKLCNMTCRHCHVDAGPDRTDAMMADAIVDQVIAAIRRTGAHTVDITGGAPELHPRFREVVEAGTASGKHVMDRCNLTVLLLPRNAGLVDWFAERGVEVVASLPHYRRPNTDAQRGDGVFERSIKALRLLNAAGYGQGDARRRLTLVSNPAGAFLGPSQGTVEREWRQSLERDFGVTFDRLFVLNNMPISRFLEWLETTGNLDGVHGTPGQCVQPRRGGRGDVPQHPVGGMGRPAVRLRLQPDARPRAGRCRKGRTSAHSTRTTGTVEQS